MQMSCQKKEWLILLTMVTASSQAWLRIGGHGWPLGLAQAAIVRDGSSVNSRRLLTLSTRHCRGFWRFFPLSATESSHLSGALKRMPFL